MQQRNECSSDVNNFYISQIHSFSKGSCHLVALLGIGKPCTRPPFLMGQITKAFIPSLWISIRVLVFRDPNIMASVNSQIPLDQPSTLESHQILNPLIDHIKTTIHSQITSTPLYITSNIRSQAPADQIFILISHQGKYPPLDHIKISPTIMSHQINHPLIYYIKLKMRSQITSKQLPTFYHIPSTLQPLTTLN